MKKLKKILFLSLLLLSMIAQAQLPDTLKTLSDTLNYYRATAKPLTELNSDAVEYAPSISADGRTMIIESNRDGRYLLYDSKLVNGSWTTLEPIDAINNFGDASDLIGGPSISFDGNTLFFFASFKEGLGSEDIFFSERNGEEWSTPENIGAPINSSGYEGFPSISADGQTLYFVRQNFAGPSDKDLAKEWVNKACFSILKSEKASNGSWSEPELLPYPINQDCEKAPRIMADNKTLIFASNRLGGKGDFDLYQTQLNAVGDWKAPLALEYVNTPLADQFSSISAQGDLLYYVYDASDIYSVQIPPHLRQFKNVIIQGYITDGITGEGVEATITVSDAFTSGEIMQITNNPNDGRYTVVLAVGSDYNVQIQADGHTSKSLFYDLSEADEYEEIDQNIELFSSAKLALNIYDSDLFEPVSTDIRVRETGKTEYVIETQNNATGRITLDLPLGAQYEITVNKENFTPKIFTLDVSSLVVYPDFIRDVEMAPIKRNVEINVADLVNNGRVRSRVRIRNRNRDEVISINGNETVALRVGDRYGVEATSDQGYAFNSTEINVLPEGQDIEITTVNDDGVSTTIGSIELKLQPLIPGSNLTLKDILFETNSDQMTEISFVELERVVDLIKQNTTLKVEVAAHTDDVGSAAYNASLSERRAQTVAQFLLERKVVADQFLARGYGESQPLVPNDSEENRAKNRRVILKILEI